MVDFGSNPCWERTDGSQRRTMGNCRSFTSKSTAPADGKGRPRVDDRAILNGILWVLRTGAPWHDMPNRYPPYQTCHRRFQEWVEKGVFEEVLRALVKDVKERGGLDLTECFID